MLKPLGEVAQDFNRIAAALRALDSSDALTPAERSLLRLVPRSARRAMDVGCGDGRFARALARRGLEVTAIDLSPGMIELARERTSADLLVAFRVADLMTGSTPGETFDLVTSISMAHHLPLAEVVPRLAGLVAPGGTLLIQDVTDRDGIRHLPTNVVAALRSRLRRLLRYRQSRRVAELYDRHGKGEQYLAASDVERNYRDLLPGARVINRIDWRYTVIWQRPSD
ncbi:MAG: class I SAM-dependent methyltransferase [Gemmatimonadota bacterium]|nr:class I SAM-dependent methyltransferase [Gemmatimonadota bacterium]